MELAHKQFLVSKFICRARFIGLKFIVALKAYCKYY